MKTLRSLRFSGTYPFLQGIMNSYSQIFFSESPWFAALLLGVTLINPYAGIAGLFAVILSNALAWALGYDKKQISKGFYGFNSLLSALGLAVFFEHSTGLLIIIVLASFFSLFVSLSLQGILGKYYLPFLSLPFLATIWIVILATRSFEALSFNEKGIFLLNELYRIGGKHMVRLYELSISLPFPVSLKAYFTSLGAIFFQYHILAGVLIAVGLFFYSRIALSLSLLSFYAAWIFYQMLGVDMSLFIYNYTGFNYILTGIAIGAYFFVPSAASYAWAILLTPLVALINISCLNLFHLPQLPVYSLPFNLVVLLFIYATKLRVRPSATLAQVIHQYHSPEENLYNDLVARDRLRHAWQIPIKLPFWGEWVVSQGHDGAFTHREEYRHAWDFVILGQDGKQYKNDGNLLTDYHCFGKTIVAPADGIISDIQDGIPDNDIGVANLTQNWGNTVVIKHHETLYSSLSHLREYSIKVKKGDYVKAGEPLAQCGNSGRSPYPHLHFQMQSTPYAGSRTLLYPISHYLQFQHQTPELRNYNIPALEQRVSNVPADDVLQKAFGFTPGQILEVDIFSTGTTRKTRWEVFTNYLNQSYLWDEESKSSAFFINDGIMFRFTHFEGDKRSTLYIVYLALYEVLLTRCADLAVTSEFPLHQIFSRVSLYGQDLIAPFVRLAGSSYTINYPGENVDLAPDRMTLHSSVSTRVLNTHRMKANFQIMISGGTISAIHTSKTRSHEN